MKQAVIYNPNSYIYEKFITYSKNSDINFNSKNINILSKYKYFNINNKDKKYTITLKNYIKENILNTFVLFTLLKECSRYILLYHNILNCYHGNTSTDKFILNIKDNCIYMPYKFIGNDKNILTYNTKINDFSIFFNSFYDDILYKNKHFVKPLLYYNETFIKSLSR